MFIYTVELTPDDNDTFLVTCPRLPEVTTFGESREDAVAQAVYAIEEALAARIADGQDIPAPDYAGGLETDPERGLVRLPLLSSLKVLLYGRLRRSGLTRADLQRRLGWHREQVDRLFRLDHNSRVDQIEAAFHALGSEIEVEVREAA